LKNLSLSSLLRLSLPAAVSVLLNNAFKVIDQYSVQWLGMEAQAAVGSCTFIMIGMFAIYSLVSAGAGPLVARATGAKDEGFCKQIIIHALLAAVAIGFMVLVIVGVTAPWIGQGLGLKNQTLELAVNYLQWLALFGLPLTIAPVIDAIFIAMGRTALVMVLQVLATVLNVILNPLLIYSFDLGIGGAALATGLSRGVSVIIGVFILWRQFLPQIRDLGFGGTFGRIFRIGIPISWGIGFFAIVYWAVIRYAVSPLGPSVNAALGIGFSVLEGFTWPVFWGVSMGIASLVGRYIGAGQVDQAVAAIRLAFPLLTVAGVCAGLLFWFAAEPLCRLFTHDQKVLKEAILYARILSFSQLFVAYECLAEGVLEGAGDTRPIFWWSAPINLLRVPLSWLFGIYLGYGAAGIWWVINVTTAIKACGKWSSVLLGGWKTIKL